MRGACRDARGLGGVPAGPAGGAQPRAGRAERGSCRWVRSGDAATGRAGGGEPGPLPPRCSGAGTRTGIGTGTGTGTETRTGTETGTGTNPDSGTGAWSWDSSWTRTGTRTGRGTGTGSSLPSRPRCRRGEPSRLFPAIPGAGALCAGVGTRPSAESAAGPAASRGLLVPVGSHRAGAAPGVPTKFSAPLSVLALTPRSRCFLRLPVLPSTPGAGPGVSPDPGAGPGVPPDPRCLSRCRLRAVAPGGSIVPATSPGPGGSRSPGCSTGERPPPAGAGSRGYRGSRGSSDGEQRPPGRAKGSRGSCPPGKQSPGPGKEVWCDNVWVTRVASPAQHKICPRCPPGAVSSTDMGNKAWEKATGGGMQVSCPYPGGGRAVGVPKDASRASGTADPRRGWAVARAAALTCPSVSGATRPPVTPHQCQGEQRPRRRWPGLLAAAPDPDAPWQRGGRADVRCHRRRGGGGRRDRL